MDNTQFYKSVNMKNKQLELFPKTGIELINEERRRQIEKLSYTEESDKERYKNGELYMAAHCYLAAERIRSLGFSPLLPPVGWPWIAYHWKPSPDNRIKECIKAGALFQADLDINPSRTTLLMIDAAAKEIDHLLSLQNDR